MTMQDAKTTAKILVLPKNVQYI